jgi:(2S)-methylsuccinyl-CoA dehydrogenase
MILPDLPLALSQAAEAAETFVAQAKRAVAERVAPGGKLDRRALDAQQHVAHGLAWAASYAETLRQTAAWATRLQEQGRLGEARRCRLSCWPTSISASSPAACR